MEEGKREPFRPETYEGMNNNILPEDRKYFLSET
jgi:hypothetical protein